jgi:octaprenyl-diphosphate synthase
MTALKPKMQETASPLDHLQAMMAADMKRVNEIILERMHSDVPLIPQLAGYLISSGGKRIRPLLTLAATTLYKGDMDRAYILSACVEFIHTATLLHDDVVDDSGERRGNPSANTVFGNEASVLVGDFLFSRAFQLMVADGSLDVLRILSDAAAIIAEGEVLQLSTQGDLDTSMDDYLEVIKGKTAALFAAACEVGPVVAGADKAQIDALREYGMALGMAFQIADDVLDYSASQEKLGKTVGDDFREGKMTAPVILALQQADDKERAFWTRTIGERQQNDDDLKTAQDIFARHNALQGGLDLARFYAQKARDALAKAPDSPLRQVLDEVVGFTVERDH